jgi:hypothetical protein
MKHYLIEAVDKLPIYKTPEKILKYIEMQIIIKNLPYDTKRKSN